MLASRKTRSMGFTALFFFVTIHLTNFDESQGND